MSQKLEVLEQVNNLTLERGSNPFFPTQDFVLLPIYLMVRDHWCVTFLNNQDTWCPNGLGHLTDLSWNNFFALALYLGFHVVTL